MTAASGGDEIELHNGNVIEGTIVRETETEVVIRTEGGEMTLRRSQIKSIERFRTSEEEKPKPDPAPDRSGSGGSGPVRNPDPFTPEERREWAKMLVEGRTIAAWTSDLKSTSREVNLRAISVLVRIGRPSVPWLVDRLQDGSDIERSNALFALGSLGEKARGAIPAMVDLMRNSPNVEVRAVSLISMFKIQVSVPRGALPDLEKAVIDASEDLAIGFIKVFAILQGRFREECYVDWDEDGRGENGLLGELAGSRECRGGRWVARPLLERRLGVTDSRGRAEYVGYYSILYLPGKDRAFSDAAPRAGEGVERQEKEFVLYAFPSVPGRSGNRVFAISSSGRVMYLPNRAGRWGGDKIPPPGLAFQSGRDPSSAAAVFVSDGQKGGASERWVALRRDKPTADKRLMVITLINLSPRAVDGFLDELREMSIEQMLKLSLASLERDFSSRFEKVCRAAGYASVDALLDRARRVLGGDRFTDIIKRHDRIRREKVEELVQDLLRKFRKKKR
jgi:hypothetical protein